jgi:hypothetical protein
MRALLIALVLGFSWWSSYYGEQYIKGNSDAILILVTVFTVFAGFLVAIIAILGDPAMIPTGSWRIAENRREAIEARLIAHMWLFVFYLIAIGLLFLGVILKNVPAAVVPDLVKIWIARAYLFFGISSFLFTFGLAKSLFAFQIARIDAEIDRRRKEAGIKDGTPPRDDGS